ncbi:unnamed protein product [Cuscuta europaea]|uniref:Transposase-associated domain-containing protein n=1 Tax=Cuscuta europaea TaxID=41803 RepID=A0A9P0ZQT1_CUSEU|nr:unnamed protein product [Cuscuta europaea]
MDRSWMYGRRDTSEFFIGANGFIKAAVTHQKQHGHKGILCPCLKCRNLRRESDTNVILQHLFERGFRENYIIWTLHGETFQDGENVVPRTAASNLKRKAPDTTTNLNWNNENNGDDDFNDDHMDEFLKDVHDNFEQKPKSYESMVDAVRIPLYSTSTFIKLSAVLKLFHLKAKHALVYKTLFIWVKNHFLCRFP